MMTSFPRIAAEILEELKSLDLEGAAGPYVVQTGFLLSAPPPVDSLGDTVSAWLGVVVLRVGTQSEAECGNDNRSVNMKNIRLLKQHTHTAIAFEDVRVDGNDLNMVEQTNLTLGVLL